MAAAVSVGKRWVSRVRRVHLATLRSWLRPEAAPDGLPLPSPALRFLVGWPDAQSFFRSGERIAILIQETLARHGVELERLGALLDFGVGCGRVARHWKTLEGVEIHGSDYNPKLVAWCRKNLTFGSFEVNQLAPPLPYADERFGLVYAYSVFTHLPEELQLPWIQELRRVLSPGGYLFLTTHGRGFSEGRLTPKEQAEFADGRLVVRAPSRPGTNRYAAFHPPSYVSGQLAGGFEVLEHVEGAGPGPRGKDQLRQDVYLLRRAGA